MDVIEQFQKTQASKNREELVDLLALLSPERISIEEVILLISFIERKRLFIRTKGPHYNIFGTGADKIKTTNISTIAAIAASKKICVVKTGSRAVTSKIGSADINPFIEKHRGCYRFFSTQDFGFPYPDELIRARKVIFNENIPDIYKVIFPFANLTGNQGQVNGVANEYYYGVFVTLAELLKRNSVIVHNMRGCDELFIGRNRLTRIRNGKRLQEIEFEIMAKDGKIDDALLESEDIESEAVKVNGILSGNVNNDLLSVVNYNAASILLLSNRFDNIKDAYVAMENQNEKN